MPSITEDQNPAAPAPAPPEPAPRPDAAPAAGEPTGSFVAEAVLLDGPVLRRAPHRVGLRLASRAPAALEGSCRVLATASWKVAPGRELPFRLAPGESLYRVLEVSLPRYASPGPYDFVVRVESEGRELGTLVARLTRPIEWVVAGPFPRPRGGESLPPERGVNLDARLPTLGGRDGWRFVPEAAYDATGALALDAVYGAPTEPQCACGFTVLEAAENRWLHWAAQGADLALLNGSRLVPGKPARMQRGRNTLLVRACGADDSWRLGFALLDESGEWLRGIENDLARILEGFDGLHGKAERTAAHRVVTLRYRNPAARAVQVLGTFNAWTPADLQRLSDGTWRRELLLAPGSYAYKLRVDGRLVADPSAGRSELDGFGGRNSLLIVE